MSKKRVLFVLGKYNFSGPVNSLIALLDHVDRANVEVFVTAIDPRGPLKDEIAKRATIIESDAIMSAFALPKHGIVSALARLWAASIPIGAYASRLLISRGFGRRSMKVVRQNLWLRFGKDLPTLTGHYDVAIGFSSAFTSYFVVDCVDAKHKYHSVIADSRILGADRRIEEIYLRKMTGALAVSENTLKIFVEMYKFMHSSTRVLYNYIPHSFRAELKNRELRGQNRSHVKSIVTVTRLDPLKGLDMAIETCEILRSRGIQFQWLVLGDGAERSRLERKIHEKSLGDVFILVGFAANPELFLSMADVYVHPSETEGKAVSIDEAKFLGIPVVATRFDTVSDQVEDGVNGLLADFSAESLANAIELILSDNALAGEISANNVGKADSDMNGDLTDYLNSL